MIDSLENAINNDELSAKAKLAAIVESSDDAIITQSLDGTVLSWNQAAERMYGYTADEIVGQSISRIVPPEALGELLDILDRLGRGGYVRSFETIRRNKSGKRLDISLTISPIHDAKGQVVAASAIGRNISDRDQLESHRVRQGRFLRNALEYAPVGIQWLTQDGRIVRVNQAILELVQCSPGEYIGRLAGEFFEDSGRATGILRRLRDGEMVKNIEARLLCQDGTRRNVLINANIMPENDDDAYSCCFIIDISRRKQMEQWIRESESRFRAMADDAPVLIWMSGTDMKCTYFNAGWLKFTGRTMEQEIGEGWAEGVHPIDIERCQTTYQSAFEARNPFEMEYRLRRYDGQFRWVLDTGTPRFTPDGTFLGFIGSCVDITERKEAEYFLEERNRRQTNVIRRESKRRRQAERMVQEQVSQLAHFARVATMGEMASGLAHELNQPLCAIVNFAEASIGLLDERSIDGEIRKNLRSVAEQAERAGEVIRRLREFIRKRTPVVQPVDLNELVQEGLKLARADFANESSIVELQLSDESLSVRVDKIQIQQVLLNLMRNGLDAMALTPPKKRALVVSVERHDEKCAAVSVSDSGCGMVARDAEKAFEPFFSTKPNGIGMGLSISRSIIQAHDGSLWVTPRPEGGTTFTFTIPMAKGASHDQQTANRIRC